MALRREVQSIALKDRLSIELNQDHRHGAVRYGTEIFHAKVNFIDVWFWYNQALLSRHLVPLFSWITEHEVVIPSCFVVGNIFI